MRQPWDNIEGCLTTGPAEGKRGLGRPRISWIDNNYSDVDRANGKSPKKRTRNSLCDRESWAALVHSCSQRAVHKVRHAILDQF